MSRVVRALLGLGAVLVLLALTIPGASAGPPARPAADVHTATVNPISLTGEGADDPAKEVTTWQKELFGSSGHLSLSYIVDGGYGGRQNYLNGIGDFVISGVPFTKADLSQLSGGASSLIDAPVMVSAVGYLLAWGPTFTLHRSCAESDRSCKPTSTYRSQIDVPSSVLSDMLWASIPNPVSCGCFGDPGITAATAATIPRGSDTAPPTITVPAISTHPLTILRSDPSETDDYTQQFAGTAAPAEFANLPHFSPPITEFVQGEANSQYYTSYDGVDSQLSFATSTSTQQTGAAASHVGLGVLVAVPPSASSALAYYTPPGLTLGSTPPPTPPVWIGVENTAGEFVAPSPATIDAAVDAGGNTPLYGLSHPVGGPVPAYPLAYVDHLYAPAHGLSADKAEATATVIRYLATAGQDATAPVNDGRLSPSLTASALAAANQLIASNCTQAGEEVVINSDLGRYAPVLGPLDGKTATQRQAELQAIGPMLHCVVVTSTPVPTTAAPPTTTRSTATTATTVAPIATSTVSTATSVLSEVEAPTATTTTTVASTATPTGGGSGGAPLSGAPQANSPPNGSPPEQNTGPITLLDLPLKLPWSTPGGYNNLAALVVGGGAFLLLRRLARGLSRLLRP